MGVISKLSKLAIKKSKGPVSKGRKSRWLTPDTPENDKRLASRKGFKKKVVQHIEESDARESGPQILSHDLINKRGKKAEETLMSDNVDANNYTPGQRRASEQLIVSQRQGQRKIDQMKIDPKPPAPLDLLTSKKVTKGQPPQRRSQKEEIIVATAKTKKSQVLANRETETPAKKQAPPSGLENVKGVNTDNPFFGNNPARGQSGKVKARMRTYADSASKRSAGFKAREALKSATPQQLSDAHAPKPPKQPAIKAPQMTLEQSNAFAKDMESMGAIERFSKETKKYRKRKK